MKKILSIILCVSIGLTVMLVADISAFASFGISAQVLASKVSMIKTGLIGQKLCFSDADFKSALVLSDFKSITITETPSSTDGTLLLGGRRVGNGRVIKRKNLSSLVFIPASDSVTECSFKFTVEKYAGGAEIECTMKFIEKVNYAPKVEKNKYYEVSTQESIMFFGNLTADDPEGDGIEYIIVSYPTHGSVEIIDDNGRYCYTPDEGYRGKDKFKYVARDEYGNYTEPVTVEVRINKRMCDTEYIDMTYREEYNAAVAMTAMGIMNGRLVGDDLYFEPDKTLTRAEFVAMTMKCAGIRPDSTLTSTYFDDDGEIPLALKGYIATAQRIGLVNGDFVEGKLIFAPNAEITGYEAATIMGAVMGVKGEGEESVFATDNDIPVWARSSVYAMYSLGIFDKNSDARLSESLTRAEAATYLYRMS